MAKKLKYTFKTDTLFKLLFVKHPHLLKKLVAERSLYYWAREYSSALPEGGKYAKLPRTIVISIVDFKLFDCAEFHSEFRPLEVSRHTPLTDKMLLHYFELPKLPKANCTADNDLKLWLSLFKANTEEELVKLEQTGRPFMAQAIKAYRSVSASEKLKELERMRFRARHDEASALHKRSMDIAKKAKNKGMGVNDIAEITGLTVDDILRL